MGVLGHSFSPAAFLWTFMGTFPLNETNVGTFLDGSGECTTRTTPHAPRQAHADRGRVEREAVREREECSSVPCSMLRQFRRRQRSDSGVVSGVVPVRCVVECWPFSRSFSVCCLSMTGVRPHNPVSPPLPVSFPCPRAQARLMTAPPLLPIALST